MTYERLKEVHAELLTMLDLLGRMVESMRDTSAEEPHYYAEGLARKSVFHLASAGHLARGTPIKVGAVEGSYCDFGSIAVLVRAALETFLAFAFLHLAPRHEPKLVHFRHLVWTLGALRARQAFSFDDPEPETVATLAEEREQIASVTKEIEAHALFATLDVKARNQARKGDWQYPYKWKGLARFGGIPQQHFTTLYKYVCDFAHSGKLALVQMSETDDRLAQETLAAGLLASALWIAAHMILAYAVVFPETAPLLVNDAGATLASEYCFPELRRELSTPFA
jgi:hypothetical protein